MTIPAGWGEDERLPMTRYNNDSRLHSQRARISIDALPPATRLRLTFRRDLWKIRIFKGKQTCVGIE